MLISQRYLKDIMFYFPDSTRRRMDVPARAQSPRPEWDLVVTSKIVRDPEPELDIVVTSKIGRDPEPEWDFVVTSKRSRGRPSVFVFF